MSIETPIQFTRAKAGRKKIAEKPAKKPVLPRSSIPRISRLMALAIHFDALIRQGTVRDYADLARLGGVTRARIPQIMNLLNLPPWKQEEILFLPGSVRGRDTLTERAVRALTGGVDWAAITD